MHDTVCIGTCVICQAPYPYSRMDRPRATCYQPTCLRAWIGQRKHDMHVRRKAVIDPWARPIPPCPDETPPPDPPRVRILADGTVALVVWAGDMRAVTGVKGGLLEPRPSHPDRLSQYAPGYIPGECAREPQRKPYQRRCTEKKKQERLLARQRRALLVAALLRGETV